MDWIVNKFGPEHGNTLMSWNILEDINFLESTEKILQKKYIHFRDNASSFPQSCFLKAKNHPLVIDGRSILVNRCPVTMKELKNYAKSFPQMLWGWGDNGTHVKTRLDTLVKFITDHKDKQLHLSSKDVFDMFEVLKFCIKNDGYDIFDGHGYICPPEDYFTSLKL
jgi:hypothetical protein